VSEIFSWFLFLDLGQSQYCLNKWVVIYDYQYSMMLNKSRLFYILQICIYFLSSFCEQLLPFLFLLRPSVCGTCDDAFCSYLKSQWKPVSVMTHFNSATMWMLFDCVPNRFLCWEHGPHCGIAEKFWRPLKGRASWKVLRSLGNLPEKGLRQLWWCPWTVLVPSCYRNGPNPSFAFWLPR
jgi:hypothetical protein